MRPELNRADAALGIEIRSHLNLLLLSAVNMLTKALFALATNCQFSECFNSLPRAVLECSARDQLLPEAEVGSLQNRLSLIETEMRNLGSSLERREADFASLQCQIVRLQNSRSWKITAPLRALGDFLRATAGDLTFLLKNERLR